MKVHVEFCSKKGGTLDLYVSRLANSKTKDIWDFSAKDKVGRKYL